MPNRLNFNESPSTVEQINNLSDEEVATLTEALERIKDSPLPNGENITAVSFPPVVINYYRDEYWRVSFYNSYFRLEGEYEIRILAIDAV